MSDSLLYISRRCKYCQELLILIHKNKKDISKLFRVVDIDKNQFPKYVTSVPLLKYGNTLIHGSDITEQINMYLSEIKPRNVTKPDGNMMPMISSNKDIYSNKHNTQSSVNNSNNVQNNPDKDKYDNTINHLDSYCVDGVCSIEFSSIDNNDIDSFIYDKVDFESNTPESSNMHVNSDHESIDNSLEKLMNERNDSLSPSNDGNIQNTLNLSLD